MFNSTIEYFVGWYGKIHFPLVSFSLLSYFVLSIQLFMLRSAEFIHFVVTGIIQVYSRSNPGRVCGRGFCVLVCTRKSEHGSWTWSSSAKTSSSSASSESVISYTHPNFSIYGMHGTYLVLIGQHPCHACLQRHVNHFFDLLVRSVFDMLRVKPPI